VDVFEVVLEEADVSKAILGYITANKIQSIALGGASRNAFTKYANHRFSLSLSLSPVI
jgi:hypothetical protein